ncbi:MAG: TIGR03915 family putative DNA repair protein [Lachnospiraceae bacterium]|nr:TIGR03915 family putative DNA repair protein [Lachnospiraceae bacterium]
MEEKYLICEDSIEGIFTGIYDAYALRESHEHLHIQVGEEENLRLFAQYVHIVPDSVKTVKVAETLRKRFGEETYFDICRAIAAEDSRKGEAVYKSIVVGLSQGGGKRVLENLANPNIELVFRLARNTANESYRFLEVVRFKESKEGILFSKIGPKCNVIPFIMPHFSDRLPMENFIIYDDIRNIYGVHPAGKDWYIVSDTEKSIENLLEMSEKECEYQELFTMFCDTIAIKERKNPKLQQQMLPLRFQEYMVEFENK